MRFSQRHGYTPVKDVLQRESMDDDLRVGLWNVLHILVFERAQNESLAYHSDLDKLAFRLWNFHFKLPADTVPDHGGKFSQFVRGHVLDGRWYEVYDLLEFVVQNHPRAGDDLAREFNVAMERELSAYRFVGKRVTPITSPEEVAEIEKALGEADGGARTHLATALDMLADRDSPDYRNSIKESISAVEATVNRIEGKKGTLGTALKKLGVDAHPALREAFTRLYGYTSDAEGIRHALAEEPGVEFEDAKFMLVSCSAFVNYLRAKAARANVAL